MACTSLPIISVMERIEMRREDTCNRLEIARDVLRLRLSQLLINETMIADGLKIPLHLALGHEAIAVAVHLAMAPGDSLLLTHRNIHYNLTRADDFASGYHAYHLCNKGLDGARLGSMNLSNPAKGLPYSSSILANNLPVAAGVALGATVLGDGSVCFVTTGDGALEEGAFYEALQFMKSRAVSCVIIAEVNEWSLASHISERRCAIDLEAFCRSLAIPYRCTDGGDVFACLDAVNDARHAASAGTTPVLLEVPVETLGWYTVHDERAPDGRTVNYHQGPARHLETAAWPALDPVDKDPVEKLKDWFDPAALAAEATAIQAALRAELA